MKTMDEKSALAPLLVLDEEGCQRGPGCEDLRLSPLLLPPTLPQPSRAHLLPSAAIADKRLPRGTPSARSAGPCAASPP